MSLFWNGVGGSVTFTPTGGAPVTVANKSWGKNRKNKVNEITNALSGGNEQYISGVAAQDGTVEIFWDSTLPPELAGIIEGNTGVIVENFGNSGRYYTHPVIIESIAPKVDAQQGAIMYTLSYKGNGTITLT